MNSFIFTGRFTRDPEIRYTEGENAMCIARYSIAVNRRFKKEGEPDADFIGCVSFGKTAEFIEKYFRKGMKADCVGEVRNNNYTDSNGTKHYSYNIYVNSIEFGESKKNNPSAESNGEENANQDEDNLPF